MDGRLRRPVLHTRNPPQVKKKLAMRPAQLPAVDDYEPSAMVVRRAHSHWPGPLLVHDLTRVLLDKCGSHPCPRPLTLLQPEARRRPHRPAWRRPARLTARCAAGADGNVSRKERNFRICSPPRVIAPDASAGPRSSSMCSIADMLLVRAGARIRLASALHQVSLDIIKLHDHLRIISFHDFLINIVYVITICSSIAAG